MTHLFTLAYGVRSGDHIIGIICIVCCYVLLYYCKFGIVCLYCYYSIYFLAALWLALPLLNVLSKLNFYFTLNIFSLKQYLDSEAMYIGLYSIRPSFILFRTARTNTRNGLQ